MTDPQENTCTLESADGVKIFYREYQTEEERGRLVIANGIGEHSGRYGNVVSKLLPGGISVWAVDLRGHGKSGGRRGTYRHLRTTEMTSCQSSESQKRKCRRIANVSSSATVWEGSWPWISQCTSLALLTG